jgi:uncharacterized protein
MQAASNRIWPRLLALLAQRPVAAAVTAVMLVALCAALVRAPVIEGSMIDEMSGSSTHVDVLRQIRRATGDRTSVAVIVRPPQVPIGAVFRQLGALRERLQGLDPAAELQSIDAARETLFLYGLSAEDTVTRLLGVLRDNPRTASLISADASRYLIVVTCPPASERRVMALLRDAAPGGADADSWRVLASVQLANDIAASLLRDLRLLIPVIVVTMLAALLLAFGRWRALVLPVFASIASTVVTFALFSAAGVTINLVTLLALPVVLIVGLANSCHFLAKSQSVYDVDHDAAAAVASTLQTVGPPFFFSTLTTAIALASLAFNDVAPIANLGRLSAAALVIAFVLILLAAPLSLHWHLAGRSPALRGSRPFLALSRWLAARRTAISIVLLLAMAAGAATIPLLKVRSDPRAFFPDGSSFSSALSQFEREFYVFSPLRILVTVDPGSHEPGFALRQAGMLRDALEASPAVRQVQTDPAVDRQDAFVLSVLLAGDDQLAAVLRRIERQRESMSRQTHVAYTSARLVYEDIDRRATASLLRSLGWSVMLIFGAILLVFRSPQAVAGTVLANAVPLMLVCGVVWLIGKPLNLVTVFVFLVALGVIVDDAIHILFSRTAGNRLAGSSIEFSVILSTVMLCLGLLLCQLSNFPTTREFAAYCALALVAAVVSNLTVLPLLLRWPDGAGVAK